MNMQHLIAYLIASIFYFTLTQAGLAQSTPINNESMNQAFNFKIDAADSTAQTQIIRVKKGTHLQLHFLSNADGAIHLHAYHLEVKVNANQSADLNFDAQASGKFKIEWHPSIKEHASSNALLKHEGPPLISLEVMPD